VGSGIIGTGFMGASTWTRLAGRHAEDPLDDQ
jgi:hypothetical protein